MKEYTLKVRNTGIEKTVQIRDEDGFEDSDFIEAVEEFMTENDIPATADNYENLITAEPLWQTFSAILEAAHDEYGEDFRVWETPKGKIVCTASMMVEPRCIELKNGVDYEWDGTIFARV
ncbi:MAG: hypothetical protein V2B18_21200 [Pseudomonadota bacterium]